MTGPRDNTTKWTIGLKSGRFVEPDADHHVLVGKGKNCPP
tara:strand:+ start:533 stop:652 length:120 start_codon:yes stop_codon:yes gene_type:complete